MSDSVWWAHGLALLAAALMLWRCEWNRRECRRHRRAMFAQLDAANDKSARVRLAVAGLQRQVEREARAAFLPFTRKPEFPRLSTEDTAEWEVDPEPVEHDRR